MKRRTISDYFSFPKKVNSNNSTVTNDESYTATSAPVLTSKKITSDPLTTTREVIGEMEIEVNFTKETSVTSNEESNTIAFISPENDIRTHIGKKPSDFVKSILLEQHWKPPVGYNYPFSVSGGVRRYLSPHHITSYPWIVYSGTLKGLFCKYCALFSDEKCGHNKGMALKKLVNEPLTNFKKLTGKDSHLAIHDKLAYHRENVEKGKNFLLTLKSPKQKVINQVNAERLKQVQKNRERLRPIIETIILCGRQNIPLRGHRDDGDLFDPRSESVTNDGNFRELLRFRIASGDKVLEQHLKTTSSRATYISNSSQNKIIQYCSEGIMNTIHKRIQDSQFFSVIFDETTDISQIEQMSLSIRYLHQNSIREDFIGFIDAYDAVDTTSSVKEPKLTGKALGKVVINELIAHGFDLKNCVGIGTDSCSVMVSEMQGAVSEILKIAPNACRCPCYNHALNNSVSKSSNVGSIQNTIGTIKMTNQFFKQSAKRTFVLKSHLGGKLSGLCETRWVERHDAVIQFWDGILHVVEALQDIAKWKDSSSASKAVSIAFAICNSEFLFSLACLVETLKITLPLSRKLQSETLDRKVASNLMKDVICVLKGNRKMCEVNFKDIAEKVNKLAIPLDVDIKLPRLVNRQINRANYDAQSVEEYYRLSLYIPLLDNLISDLENRLPERSLQYFNLRLLMPDILTNINVKDIESELTELAKLFEPFLKFSVTCFLGEVALWKAKWHKVEAKPISVLEAIAACDEEIYPTIRTMLKILATLPVSVATAERSFSTLRRLKTWLRSNMKEDRLSSLAIINVHRDIAIDIDEVIDKFARDRSGKHRYEFVL